MRKNLRKYLTAAPLVLAIGLACSVPVMAEPSGHLDWANRYTIAGWAWDETDSERTMEVKIDITPTDTQTAVKTLTVTADSYRGDLASDSNDGSHGFFCPVNWSQFSGDSFTITAYIQSEDGKIPLTGTISYDTSAEGAVLAAISTTKETVSGTGRPAEGPLSGSISPVSGSSEKAEEAEEETDTIPEPAEASEEKGPVADTSAKGSGPLARPSDSTSDSSKETDSESGWKKGASLGRFTITGYCNCSLCSNGWGLTYSGTVPRANHTISADLDVLPLGTKVMIDGIVYTVEDKGSGVNDNHIDIYYASHEEAVACGTRSAEVFAVIAE